MTSVDQIQKRIEFFGQSNQTKERIAKNENERIRLEIELNKLVNSDQAGVRNKAIRLRTYYKNLCDSEEKSLKRNQYLLAELQRVDAHFQQLEVKLDRLNTVRRECENYLKTAYPRWTKESDVLNPEPVRSPRLDNPSINSLMASLNINQSGYNTKKANDPIDSVSPREPAPPNSTIKNLVFGPSALELQKSLKKIEEPVAAGTSGAKSSSMGTMLADNLNKTRDADIERSNEFIKNLIMSIKSEDRNDLEANNNLMTNAIDNKLVQEYEKELKRQELNTVDFSFTANSINFDEKPKDTNKLNSFSTTQINSQNFNEKPKANSTAMGTEQLNDNQSSLRQNLNLPSFFYLLDFIERQISRTIHPENYYRQVETQYKNKLEIIRLARNQASLDDMSPADVSMVVLDQLPLVIQKYTEHKCLFTRDLLGLSITDINENLVNRYLNYQTDKNLFSRLLKHMVFLKRFAFMSVSDLASVFGPSFVGSNRAGQQKAAQFLEKLLNEMLNPSAAPPLANYQLNLTDTLNDSKSLTETSINQELLIATNSKLKDSNVYQDFINSTQSSNRSKQIRFADQKKKQDNDFDDDDNDEIDALVAPNRSGLSNNSSILKNSAPSPTKPLASITIKSKSPRNNEFDFSQSSASESQKLPASLKLSSIRSSTDKKQLPVYLRDPDSDDETSSETGGGANNKKNHSKSDADFDFYN